PLSARNSTRNISNTRSRSGRTSSAPTRIRIRSEGSVEMDRRNFLKHAGCAACALGADHLLLRVSSAVAAEAYAKLDQAARLNLADMALDLAKRAGSSYADVRIGRSEQEFSRARERRLEEFNS